MRDHLVLVAAAAGALFLLLLTLERLRPLRAARHSLVPEVLLNLALSALAFATAALLVNPAAAAAMRWSAREELGLLHLVALPAPVRGALAFLGMDLTFYYWHRLNHEVPFLWRLHNVHHTDPALGAATSFRFHFGEVALSTVFRVLQVSLLGIDLPAYAAYELVFQGNTLFHHCNLRLPIRLERRLNLVLVTPRMHGIHHSQVQAESLSNFSVVFSWWDRLHRTLRLNVPQALVAIGVPGYSRPEDNRLLHLLAMPFLAQRDYWLGADGRPVVRDPGQQGPRPGQMEE